MEEIKGFDAALDQPTSENTHVVDVTCETDQYWFFLLDKQGHVTFVVKLVKILNRNRRDQTETHHQVSQLRREGGASTMDGRAR